MGGTPLIVGNDLMSTGSGANSSSSSDYSVFALGSPRSRFLLILAYLVGALLPILEAIDCYPEDAHAPLTGGL